MNVCALIASVSIENWLTANGKLAFLMPKVIAFQQSYEGFRKFKFHKVKRDFIGFYDWSKAGHPFDPIKEKFMTYVIGNSKERKEFIPVKEFVKKKGVRIAREHHITLKEAMDRLEEKTYVAGQVIPESTIFTFADSNAELQSFKKISGKPDYIGREGVEFYPQELLLFNISKNPPTEPQKGHIYVTNVQFGKSRYRIPEDTFELETQYLYPLVKGTEIEEFQHNYGGIVVPFPYEESDCKRPLDQQQLHSKSPNLLKYYLKYKHTIESQTDYSDKIRGQNAGEFYGLARVGNYSFANHYVAFRDNTKWCSVVISPMNMEWGGKKRFVFQNHAVAICEDENNRFITENEAHYICAILNAPIVKKFMIRSSDSRSFKIRPPIKIPKFNSENETHRKLSILSIKAHLDRENTEAILKEIDNLYISLFS